MVLSSFVYADTAYTTDDVSPRENHVENGSGGGISQTGSDKAKELAESSNGSDLDEIGSGGQKSAARILSFIALKNEMLRQEYSVGISREALCLPDELEVEVKDKSEILTVPVKWISEPEFDGSAEGEYVFRPEIEDGADYEIAEGIELPAITVSIKANSAEDDNGANESETIAETIKETELTSEAETAGETELTSEEETSGETELASEAETSVETELASEEETSVETELTSEAEATGETELASEAEILETISGRYVLKRRKENSISEASGGPEVSGDLDTSGDLEASGGLKVTKKVEGNEGETKRDWEFEVHAEASSGDLLTGSYGDLDFEDGIARFTLKSGDFKGIPSLPEGTKYTVTEKGAGEDGYTTTITEGGSGTSGEADGMGEIIADATGELTFTNCKDSVGVTIPLTKNLAYEGEGYNPPAHDFVFKLEGTSASSSEPDIPMPAETEIRVTVDAGKKEGSIANIFDGVKFTQPGTYTYTLTELPGENSDVQNDKVKERTITVQVNKDESGHLTVSVNVTGSSAEEGVVFTNIYEPKAAELSLDVSKRLENGTQLNEGDFEFTLEALDGAPMPPEAKDSNTLTMHNGEGTVDETVAPAKAATAAVDFGEITYTKPGIYEYEISEKSGTDSDIDYDETTYTVTVTVTDIGGKLNASAIYSPTPSAGTGDGAVFTNKRLTGSLEVEKQVSGTAASTEDSFGFTVELGDKTINGWYGKKPDNEEAPQGGDGMYFVDGVAHITLKGGENRKAEGLSAGTTYTVTEDDNGDYAVSVSGADTISGAKASGTIPSGSDEKIVYTNKKESVDVALKGVKEFPGAPSEAMTHSFTLTAGSTSAGADTRSPMPKGGESGSITTSLVANSGTFAFGEITYKKAGSYYYTLTEETGGNDAVIYDTAEYAIRVDVTSDNGQLEAAVFWQKQGAAGAATWTKAEEGNEETLPVFTNRMKATASLKVRKTLDVGPHGGHLDGKTFTFQLTPHDGTTVLPAHDTITVTVDRNHAEGEEKWINVSAEDFFDGVSFGEGTYSYTLTEEEGTDPYPGVHYTHKHYTVDVVVTKAQDGTLQAVVKLDGEGDSDEAIAAFENSYDPKKASVTLRGRKILEGGAFTKGEFTFVLSAGKDMPWPDDVTEQQVTVGADGSWTYEVKNRADKTFTFGKITFEKTGTYVYEIREKNDGGRTDVVYDNAVYKVTVVVEEGTINGEDTHEGVESMTRTVTYEKNGEPVNITDGYVSFTNRMKTGDLTVTKTVTGNAGDPDKEWHFTVTLIQNNATAPLSGTYGEITFTDGIAGFTLKSGESKKATGLPEGVGYTVTEAEAGQDGYKTAATGDAGVISAGAPAEAEFTNYKSEPHKTEETPGAGRSVQLGDLVTYRISYENAGTKAMTILITDPLDVGLDFVSAPETPAVEGSYTAPAGVNDASARTVTWTLKDVPAGTQGFVELTVKVNTEAVKDDRQVANQASVQFGNDPAIKTETIENPAASGSLKVTKTVTGNAGDPNKEWHFTVTLTQDNVTAPVSGTYGEMTFADGIAGFTLKSGESKEAAGLPAGIGYTVTEAEAGQDGYMTTAMGDVGTIASDHPAEATFVNNKEEHQSQETPGKGSIRVVKKLFYNGKPVYVDNQTFYVALFEDPECTVMVSAIMPLNFVEASSATAVFDGVEVGKTYYVAELDAEGNVIRGSGHLGGLIEFNVNFYNGNKAVVTENGGTVSVQFANEFVVISERFHMTENLEITKILLDPDGSPCDSDRIFYAGIFDDPEFTQPSGQVNRNIVPLKLNGNSSVTAHVDVRACMEGEQIFLYVTEVDEDGQPVDDSIGCRVTVENGEPVFDEWHGRWDVTITNQMAETETESESETDSAEKQTDETEATSVKTGDDTPVMWYLLLLISAAAVLSGMLVFRRRRNRC